MMRSRVKVTTMLLVLIFSLTGLCSAKDNKPPGTKVTAFIHISDIAITHFFLLQLNSVISSYRDN